jgi:hypothetical protein
MLASRQQTGGHGRITGEKVRTHETLSCPVLRDPEDLKVEASGRPWVCGTRTRQQTLADITRGARLHALGVPDSVWNPRVDAKMRGRHRTT